jgi:hypothetical protein
LLAPPTNHLHLKFLPADTNNGDAAVFHKNPKNPPKSPFRQSEHTADRSLEFEEHAGGHEPWQILCLKISNQDSVFRDLMPAKPPH